MDLPKKGARQIRGLGNIIAHRVELQGECLLVMGGDSRVQSGPHDPLWTKTPPGTAC